MNLFALDIDPVKAARYNTDIHCHAIRREAGQQISTAIHSVMGKIDSRLCKPTHEKHGCILWCQANRDNFTWAIEYFKALCDEYRYRKNLRKPHAYEAMIPIWESYTTIFRKGSLTPFYQAMPQWCRMPDPVLGYRVYYSYCKDHLHRWTKRGTPEWL